MIKLVSYFFIDKFHSVIQGEECKDTNKSASNHSFYVSEAFEIVAHS
jgi:hypothetical protein